MPHRLGLVVIILATCLFGFQAHSQEIKDGFIIHPDGKYEYGYIQFDPSVNVYDGCLFRAEGRKEFLKFTTNQITGYGVINGVHFLRKEVNEGNTIRSYFLKKLLDEKVKIYSLEDKRFFIGQDNLTELSSGNFKVMLKEALSSCKSIQSFIKRSSLTIQDLSELFIQYKRCTDPESATIPFKRFHIDLVIGFEKNTFQVSGGPIIISQNKIELLDKVPVQMGANVFLSFKRTKQISIGSGVYYCQQNLYTLNKSRVASYFITDKINLDYQELRIPLFFQYSLFKEYKKIMPYLKGGLLVPITVNSSITWEVWKEYTNTIYFEQYNVSQQLKQPMMFTLAFGLSFKLINGIQNTLEFSYLNGKGKASNNANSIEVTSNQLAIMLGVKI